jgi:uncharacterized RDD family membrane protein YckC
VHLVLMEYDSTKRAENEGDTAAQSGRKCPVCGANIVPDAEACPECGQRFQPSSVRYRSVGEALGVHPEDKEPDYKAHHSNDFEKSGDAPEARAQGEEEQRVAAEQRRAMEQPRQELPEDEGSQFRYLFTPQVVEAQVKPASLGKRTLALALDWVTVYLVFTIVLYFIGAETVVAEVESIFLERGWAAFADPEALPAGVGHAMELLTVLILALLIGLYAVFTAYGGSTPGKAIMGIKVTKFDGSEVGLGAALLRSAFLWVFTYLTMGLYLVFAGLYCLIDPYGRSVHDIVAGTRVTRRS